MAKMMKMTTTVQSEKTLLRRLSFGLKIKTYFVIFAIRIAFFSDALIHKSLEK